MSNIEKQPITLAGIKAWLAIIVLVGSVIAGWTVMDQRVQMVQVKLLSLELKVERIGQENNDLKVRLAEIQKDVLYIRQSLDEHMRYTQPGTSGNK